MFHEDELQPISALQHLAFCERQWGLIHLERIWDESQLTAEGRILHDRAHEGKDEERAGVRIVRGLPLRSLRWGLIGKADVIEFQQVESARDGAGLPGARGYWRPFPVEYKRGRPKAGSYDLVQLCAQALCLEEALSTRVEVGAIYYGQPKRRLEVPLDNELRDRTAELIHRLHERFRAGRTPLARYETKCKNCSLLTACLPKSAGSGRQVGRYLQRVLNEALKGDS